LYTVVHSLAINWSWSHFGMAVFGQVWISSTQIIVLHEYLCSDISYHWCSSIRVPWCKNSTVCI